MALSKTAELKINAKWCKNKEVTWIDVGEEAAEWAMGNNKVIAQHAIVLLAIVLLANVGQLSAAILCPLKNGSYKGANRSHSWGN